MPRAGAGAGNKGGLDVGRSGTSSGDARSPVGGRAATAGRPLIALAILLAGLIGPAPALASPGGEIRGAVTAAATAAPLQGVEVCAEAELFGSCATTGVDGEYAIAELPEGSYTVVFDRLELEGYEYLTQYYSERALRAEADPVAVLAEAATPAVNAAMQRLRLPGAPAAETLAASQVAATSATLNASVDPNGAEVLQCELQYGTSVSYGKSEPCPTPPGSGTSAVSEAVGLGGLSADTEYHYRVLARNEFGWGTGEDVTFRTLPLAPAVAGVSPAAGLQEGHTSVTVTGARFTAASTVRFGAAAALHVTVDSASEITAESPPGTGTVNVTVTTVGGTSPTSAADQFTYVVPGPAPTLTRLSSRKGVPEGGTGVIITGSGFAGVTSVRFGAANAGSFKVETPTSISAVSPPGTTGSVDVTVTTPNGTSATSQRTAFLYGRPTVTGVSPATGPRAGGTRVTVTGGGFAVGAGLTVLKAGRSAMTEVNCASNTECTAVMPAATRSGAVDVRATVAGKSSAKSSPAVRFTYV